MDLVIETDLGHDPDDFFAISYLMAVPGINVRAITIVPGDPDQIAIARLLIEQVGLDIPVGASKLNRGKLSSGSVHHQLLKKYGKSLESKPDGLGKDILADVLHEKSELFIIGPASSVGAYLREHPDARINRATMQGGFLPYSLFRPQVALDKFEGLEWIQTFNLNGDRKGAVNFLEANIQRQMVGKNICHTVVFDRSKFEKFAPPPNRAAEMFLEAAELYLEKHTEKKFHDPTAAVCHVHPEIGGWIFGKTVKREAGWSTDPGNRSVDRILGEIDYDMLWQHLQNWD